MGTALAPKTLPNYFHLMAQLIQQELLLINLPGKAVALVLLKFDEDAALKAIKDLNGTMQDGRSIKVTEARPKEEKTGYSNNRW